MSDFKIVLPLKQKADQSAQNVKPWKLIFNYTLQKFYENVTVDRVYRDEFKNIHYKVLPSIVEKFLILLFVRISKEFI